MDDLRELIILPGGQQAAFIVKIDVGEMVFDFFHRLLIAYFPCVLVLYEILLHLLQRNAISLDASNPGTELESLHESIPSGFEVEKITTDHLLMEELKAALRKWKPWAEELLDLYLSGAKRSSTTALCEKYHLSSRAVQKRKADFEKFVLNFLGK